MLLPRHYPRNLIASKLWGIKSYALGVLIEAQVNPMRRSLILLAVLVLATQYVPHLSAAQTIDPANVEPGPIRHAELPPDLLKRASALEPVFADVYPVTHEKWIEGFRRDAHPEREIAIWEQIAVAYTRSSKIAMFLSRTVGRLSVCCFTVPELPRRKRSSKRS